MLLIFFTELQLYNRFSVFHASLSIGSVIYFDRLLFVMELQDRIIGTQVKIGRMATIRFNILVVGEGGLGKVN